jgi:hypothetical protein
MRRLRIVDDRGFYRIRTLRLRHAHVRVRLHPVVVVP